MKKFFNIALAMAAFAVVGWSCEDDQKITPVEADNSYVLSNEATPIVWAGFETIEDVYSIYLAEATPASTTSPITIEGLTINIPVEVLGVEHTIGTAGVEASLNGTPLTGGTLLVTKTDTELVVDIKDSKVGEEDFSANWEGAFTIVEGETIIEPSNSYILGTIETPIVWAGFETIEDVYAIYLAEATPTSTTSPITIDGLTITMHVSALGNEHTIGTAGVEASLNGTALTGGTLLVTKTDTELVVDIKDSKVGEDDFAANWSGAFTIVEPEVVEPEGNYYIYDGNTIELNTAIGERFYMEDLYNGYYVNLYEKVDADTWEDIEDIRFYIPVPYFGQDMALEATEEMDCWEFYFSKYTENYEPIYDYSGTGYDPNSIAAGSTLNVVIEGTTLTMTADVTFTDGKTLKVHYTGELDGDLGDGNEGGGDDDVESYVPEYDEFLSNEWQYEDDNITAINYVEFGRGSSGSNGIFFNVSDAEAVEGYFTNAIVFYAPFEMLGEEILLQQDDAIDSWEMNFWTNDGMDQNYWGNGYAPQDILNGKMIVDLDGDNVTFKVAVLFADGTVLKANYSGSAIQVDGLWAPKHQQPFMRTKINKMRSAKVRR